MVKKDGKIALLDEKEKKHSHDDHSDIGEIFVHQIIETIEFVLGNRSLYYFYTTLS